MIFIFFLYIPPPIGEGIIHWYKDGGYVLTIGFTHVAKWFVLVSVRSNVGVPGMYTGPKPWL